MAGVSWSFHRVENARFCPKNRYCEGLKAQNPPDMPPFRDFPLFSYPGYASVTWAKTVLVKRFLEKLFTRQLRRAGQKREGRRERPFTGAESQLR